MKFLVARLVMISLAYQDNSFAVDIVRTTICIENDSGKTYVINATGINDGDWAEKIGDAGPVNRPDQNLINKVVHPGKHICVNEDLNLSVLRSKDVRLNLSLLTVFNGPGLGATRRELGSSVDILFPATGLGATPDSVQCGSCWAFSNSVDAPNWTALAETEIASDESQPSDDSGFLYPTGFTNEFGEYRQYKKCPPPHRKDKNCQLFLILN